MRCWQCGKATEVGDGQRVEFRGSCPHCHTWLHSCKGCKNFNPRVSQACDVPNIEFVGDKERWNFCEYFLVRNDLIGAAGGPLGAGKTPPPDDAAKRFQGLFGG